LLACSISGTVPAPDRWTDSGTNLGSWDTVVRGHYFDFSSIIEHGAPGACGPGWKGRLQASLVRDDGNLVTLLRCVERNALQAEVVSRVEDWKWPSLPDWERGDPLPWAGEAPVRDGRLVERVNEPLGGRPSTVAANGVAEPTVWGSGLDSGDDGPAAAGAVLASLGRTA